MIGWNCMDIGMTPQLNPAAPHDTARVALSSLMDGQAGPAELPAALAAWQDGADARQAWHTYHLIGDVLRSDELATAPTSDEAFLQALRAKLAFEPVPLAPAPLLTKTKPQASALAPAPLRRGWRGWMAAPVAVAAGFVAVASVLVVTRVAPRDPAAGAQLAQAGPASTATRAAAVRGDVVRDQRLDRYLEAHRSLANGVVAAGAAEHRVQIVFEPK